MKKTTPRHVGLRRESAMRLLRRLKGKRRVRETQRAAEEMILDSWSLYGEDILRETQSATYRNLNLPSGATSPLM